MALRTPFPPRAALLVPTGRARAVLEFSRNNGYGFAGLDGVLAQSEWAKADAAVAQAWKLYADLDKYVKDAWMFPGGLSKESLTSKVTMFGKQVQNWSDRLENLKHKPNDFFANQIATGHNPIEEWKAWGAPTGPTSFAQWAREIKSTADFSSLQNGVEVVSSAIAKDASDALVTTGTGALKVLKYLPYIAVGTVVLMGGVFAWRFAKGTSDAVKTAAQNITATKSVAGLNKRRRRRRRSRK